MPGSFDTTLEKIGCINRAGIRSVVMTTVSGTNIDEVPGLIDTVVAAGVNVFAFARYCPTSGEKDTHITPQRYRQLLADVWVCQMEQNRRPPQSRGERRYFALQRLYQSFQISFAMRNTAQALGQPQ